MIFLLYLLVGIFVGTLSGLFGIGGGVIIVPTLLLIFKAQGLPQDQYVLMAIATSLSTIIITVSASTYRHYKVGNLLVEITKIMIPGVIVGAIVGSLSANFFSPKFLQIFFITYLYAVAIKMILYKTKVGQKKETSNLMYNIVSFIIGFKSGVLGIGGGTISIPFLTWRGFNMRNSVAISASLGLPTAFFSTLIYIYSGFGKDLPEYTFGYIYLPAFFGISLMSFFFTKLGVKISTKADQDKLKKVFAIFLLILATKKLVDIL